MKRSRRVILQWIGTAAIGTVSMGLGPRDCYIRGTPDAPRLARRRLPECEVSYGGFGGTPRYFAPAGPHHAGG
jgi:hypothetical protein